MAGTGKSTISRTVAQSLAEKRQLGASFFFKRGESDRGNASRFFTTIALQLVQKIPKMAPYVRSAINADMDISTKLLKEQFEKLIFQPLSQAMRTFPRTLTLAIVVDALDECDRERDIRTILQLLSQTKNLESVHMRILLTSRPELPVHLGFKEMSSDAYEDMVLEKIPQVSIEHDISVYLRYELMRVKEEYNATVPSDSQLSSDWPDEENIQALTTMAVPLFIFAATVRRFIGDRAWNDPDEQLKTVLKYWPTSQGSPESKLDGVYLPILKQLASGHSDIERLAREFQGIVGSIVILADPLPTSSLARLLGISKKIVDSRLRHLHSILSIPSDQNLPVRLLHLSLRDFLLDPKKKGKSEFWFWVDEKNSHEIIATRCLELMNNCLRQNICCLECPGKLRNEIDKKILRDCLPQEVQYACQYWVRHLEQGGRRICDQDEVYVFLQQHFLHWLEALAIMGKISESIALIGMLQSRIAVSYALGIMY